MAYLTDVGRSPNKMKREALVPIDDELYRQIGEQQKRVPQRFPAGAPVLSPRQNGNNGRKHVQIRCLILT